MRMCACACTRSFINKLCEKLPVQFIEKSRLVIFFKRLFNGGGVVSTLVCFTVLSHLIGSWDPLQSQQLPQEKDAEDKVMLVQWLQHEVQPHGCHGGFGGRVMGRHT